jgi:hypothetical protein
MRSSTNKPVKDFVLPFFAHPSFPIGNRSACRPAFEQFARSVDFPPPESRGVQAVMYASSGYELLDRHSLGRGWISVQPTVVRPKALADYEIRRISIAVMATSNSRSQAESKPGPSDRWPLKHNDPIRIT